MRCFVPQMLWTFSHKRHKTSNYFHRNTRLSLRSKRTRFTPYTRITQLQQRNNTKNMSKRITRATWRAARHCCRWTELNFESESKSELNVRLKIVHTVLSYCRTTTFITAASHPWHLSPLRAIPNLTYGRFLTGTLCRLVGVVHERNRFASPDTTNLTTNPSTGQWQQDPPKPRHASTRLHGVTYRINL